MFEVVRRGVSLGVHQNVREAPSFGGCAQYLENFPADTRVAPRFHDSHAANSRNRPFQYQPPGADYGAGPVARGDVNGTSVQIIHLHFGGYVLLVDKNSGANLCQYFMLLGPVDYLNCKG